MFAVNADDESQVVVKPLIGLTLFITLQLREERLWFVACHVRTVT